MEALVWLQVAALLLTEATIIGLLVKTRRDVLAQVSQARTDLDGRVAAEFAQTRDQVAQAPRQVIEYLEEAVVKRAMSIVGRKGAEAKQATDAEAEVAEAEAEAGLLAQLGPEIADYMKGNYPDLWEKAVRYPDMAQRILGPILSRIQEQYQSQGQSPTTGERPW